MTTLNHEDPADPSVHEPIIVWGVPALIQKAAFEKHCTGDCGKISMGGVINDDQTGGLFVCCEAGAARRADSRGRASGRPGGRPGLAGLMPTQTPVSPACRGSARRASAARARPCRRSPAVRQAR